MPVQLHAFDTPNGRKISVALEEMAPNVRRWYEAMMARPAVQRGFAVKLS